jgi:DNA-binding response OmpR family regulator
MVMARAFAKKHWEAIAVATVRQALGCFSPPPECLILDLNLPDGDGESLLEKIRTEAIPMKVVAVTTALTDPLRITRVAEFRPSLFIMKPFDWDVLVRYCATELERSDRD